jgi:hypothetical protein
MTCRLALGLLAAWMTLIAGCGRVYDPPAPILVPEPLPAPIGFTQVVGKAQFGSQCPLGFYAPPTQVPLELWTCPIGLDPVVLQEPLAPFVLQVDCKKKIMDIRGMDRSSSPSTWEIMPDGSFFFKVDGGTAKLSDDGSGHKNCSIPLFASLWGKVDCKARDQAVVDLETTWWLGSEPVVPTPQPSPTGSGFPVPSVSSSAPPSFPSVPNVPASSGHLVAYNEVGFPPRPAPGPGASFGPSFGPSSGPLPGASSLPDSPNLSGLPGLPAASLPESTAATAPSPRPSSGGGGIACQVPVGCFFHSTTQVNQCQ